MLRAEDLGADILFGYDHFHAPAFEPFVGEGPVLAKIQLHVVNFEGWTALASWGEITTRAEIGLLVTGIGYRNPDLLADMARTVDHISGGRVIRGVGAGYYEKDYTTYGYDCGTVKLRFDLFDSGLERLLAEQAGRTDADIERSVVWKSESDADAYLDAGATIFTKEIQPTAAGYDLSTLKKMITWHGNRAQCATSTSASHGLWSPWMLANASAVVTNTVIRQPHRR